MGNRALSVGDFFKNPGNQGYQFAIVNVSFGAEPPAQLCKRFVWIALRGNPPQSHAGKKTSSWCIFRVRRTLLGACVVEISRGYAARFGEVAF